MATFTFKADELNNFLDYYIVSDAVDKAVAKIATEYAAMTLTAPRPARSPKRLLWARNLQACARRR